MRIRTAISILTFSITALAIPSAFATGSDAGVHGQSAPVAASVSKLTNAEVRKIDTEQGKVTLKHEAIDNLDMPPMTMVFRVANPKMLSGLKAGDKVQFRAETKEGTITVTHMQPAK